MNQKGLISFLIISIILGIIVFVVAVIYTKSATSIPGEWDYGIKQIRERIYSESSSLTHEGNFDANIVLANERLREVVVLVERQGNEQVIKDALVKLSNNQDNAYKYTLKIKDRGSFTLEFFDRLENTLVKHRETLSDLYYHVPPELYSDLDRALSFTNTILRSVRTLNSRYR